MSVTNVSSQRGSSTQEQPSQQQLRSERQLVQSPVDARLAESESRKKPQKIVIKQITRQPHSQNSIVGGGIGLIKNKQAISQRTEGSQDGVAAQRVETEQRAAAQPKISQLALRKNLEAANSLKQL